MPVKKKIKKAEKKKASPEKIRNMLFKYYYKKGVTIDQITLWYAEYIERARQGKYTQKKAASKYWTSYSRYVMVIKKLRDKKVFDDQRFTVPDTIV